MNRIRHNRILTFTAILALGIAMTNATPRVTIELNGSSSHVQRIMPQEIVPLIAPCHLNKTTPEHAEFFPSSINLSNGSTDFRTYSTYERRTLEYASILRHSLIYTLTTSSCL